LGFDRFLCGLGLLSVRLGSRFSTYTSHTMSFLSLTRREGNTHFQKGV
jgi:hypothetical protein